MCGNNCSVRAQDVALQVYPEDGAKLRDHVHTALTRRETVRLDFSDVTTLASAFLSSVIGCLYAFFSKDDLDWRLLGKGLASIISS